MKKEKPYIIIFIYLLALLSPKFILTSTSPSIEITTLSTFVYTLGAILILFLNVKIKEPNNFENKKSPISSIILWGILGALFVLVAQYIALFIESNWLSSTATSQNTQAIVSLIKTNPFFVIATIFSLPIMEELVFRKALLDILPRRFPDLINGIISAILFSFAHNDGHWLVYFIMGFLFFLLYKKTNSIFTPIISHTLMNSFVLLIQLF